MEKISEYQICNTNAWPLGNEHKKISYNSETIAEFIELRNTANAFYTPFPFMKFKKKYPSFNSMISANYNKVEGFSAKGEILIKGIVSLL